MPVLFQSVIQREDLIRNRDVLYVYADDVIRRATGSGAYQCRLEPNGLGVRVAYSPAVYFGSAQGQPEAQARMIDEDLKPAFDKVMSGGVVVWPTEGLGRSLEDPAPATYEYLESKLAALIRAARLFQPERL